MDSSQVLRAIHRIQRKPVFILAILLITFHTVYFHDSLHIVPFGEKAFSPNPPKTVPTREPTRALSPEIQSPPLYDNRPVDGPGDHDYPPDAAPTPYIAICMAIKNQALDLQEFFVHHYHHLGIRRFYIMDDGSDPPLSTFSYPGVPHDALTFVLQDPSARSEGHSEQVAIYARCMERYGRRHKWIAFLDGDEFLETPGDETLGEILQELERNETVGALAVNWKMHSSSGLLTRPASTRKVFVHCVWDDPDKGGQDSDNRHVKVIV